MGKHRSEHEIAAAVQMYVDGKTCAQIAREVHANDGTVRGWLRAAGVELRPRTTNLHRKQRAARVDREPVLNDLLTSGDSLTIVAKRHNVPRSTLVRWRQAAENEAVVEEYDSLAYKGEWVLVGGILRGTARDVA